MTENGPITVPVGTWNWDNHAGSIRAAVFGKMVHLSWPVVHQYMSDLYHDAMWLEKYVHGDDDSFYFAIRESGTSIGTDVDIVKMYGFKVWRVTFVRGRHDWLTATFTEVGR